MLLDKVDKNINFYLSLIKYIKYEYYKSLSKVYICLLRSILFMNVITFFLRLRITMFYFN